MARDLFFWYAKSIKIASFLHVKTNFYPILFPEEFEQFLFPICLKRSVWSENGWNAQGTQEGIIDTEQKHHHSKILDVW